MMQILPISSYNTAVFLTIFITLAKSNEEVFLPTKHQTNFNSNNDQLISTTSFNSRQLVDVPVLVSSLNHTANQDQTNYYVNSQAQKFRVNVSNICEKSNMRITIRFSKPFYGLIHTKDKRKKPACSVEGNGDQVYTLEISYTLVQSEPSYCGIVSHHLSQPNQQRQNQSAQPQQTLSVALVVRLHKSIEFSDDRYFLLSCANRCSRPDCSSLLSNNQDDAQTRTLQSYLPAQPINRGFVTSESIVSPVLRASNDISSHRHHIVDSSSPNNLASTERCDIMLDLKFQWLIKLCWILSILLLMMFCTSYYLCISLCKVRSKHKKQLKDTRNSFKHQSSAIKGTVSNKNIIYPPGNDSENFSWSDAATTTTTSARVENLDKIREDNSILAKTQHHQQLLMPNHRVIMPTGPAKQQQNEFGHQQLVLGRSVVAENFGTQKNCKIDNSQRIKRRRSIGSAVTIPPNYNLRNVNNNNNNYHPSQQNQNQSVLARHDIQTNFGRQLSAGQRAKSKSQTTIHYEQRQDPFETVPFSYLNNGYLSDSNTSPHPTQRPPPPQSYQLNDQNLLSPTEAYGVNDHSQLASYQATAQVPMTECLNTHQSQLQYDSSDRLSNQSNRQEVMRLQRWPNFKSNHCPPPQTGALSQQQQQQLDSQFDPQNSRQLIDLIQQKHRQQMAQANRTANFLATQQRQNIPAQTRSWR